MKGNKDDESITKKEKKPIMTRRETEKVEAGYS
jgi:hypothetical protein